MLMLTKRNYVLRLIGIDNWKILFVCIFEYPQRIRLYFPRVLWYFLRVDAKRFDQTSPSEKFHNVVYFVALQFTTKQMWIET